MAEEINMVLGNVEAYDKAVHCGVIQDGHMTIITKDHAMQSGAAGAVISFRVDVDGRSVDVQATTSVYCLLTILSALKGRYDANGHLLAHHISDGS